MTESLAIEKLLQEAELAIQTCKWCEERGHGFPNCPDYVAWLQRQTKKQSNFLRSLWWCSLGLVGGLLLAAWRMGL